MLLINHNSFIEVQQSSFSLDYNPEVSNLDNSKQLKFRGHSFNTKWPTPHSQPLREVLRPQFLQGFPKLLLCFLGLPMMQPACLLSPDPLAVALLPIMCHSSSFIPPNSPPLRRMVGFKLHEMFRVNGRL